MGGVSDRGEDQVYAAKPVPYAPAPVPVPKPVAPPPVAPPVPAGPQYPQIYDYFQDMAQQFRNTAEAAKTAPIPWGMDPMAARQLIHYQGNNAMAGIPAQGPSPMFSSAYDTITKNAYPK